MKPLLLLLMLPMDAAGFRIRRQDVLPRLEALAAPGRAREAVERHDMDLLRCHPAPESVLAAGSLPAGRMPIGGDLLYTGANIPGRYAYDMVVAGDGSTTVVVEIRFVAVDGRAMTDDAWRALSGTLKEAADLWTAHVPAGLVGRLSFDFRAVASGGHFALPATSHHHNGPYFSRWSLAWDSKSAAHEIGHMMGLNDEYDILSRHLLRRQTRCLLEGSIMCDGDKPLPMHYYFVLRRAHCRPSQPRR